jgi:hypothetical protein
MIRALEAVFVNILKTALVASNLNVDMAIKHLQQQRIVWNYPLVSNHLIISNQHESSSSTVLRITIAYSGRLVFKLFGESSLAFSFLLSARSVFPFIARIMNHASTNNCMELWKLDRAWYFGPNDFVNLPWRQDFVCQNY